MEELVEHTLVKNKHRTLNGGQKKIVFGGPRVKEARKVLRQPTTTSLKVISVPIIQRKVQVMNITRSKEEARIRKEKRQGKGLSSIRTSSSETPREEGCGHTWESDDRFSSCWPDDSTTSATGWSCTRAHTAWMASVPLNAQCSGSWLHTVNWIKSSNQKGSRAMPCITALRQSFVVATGPLCLPIPRRSLVGKSCIVDFPTTPPCSTRVDVLEMGNVPILFSLPQMKNWE